MFDKDISSFQQACMESLHHPKLGNWDVSNVQRNCSDGWYAWDMSSVENMASFNGVSLLGM